MASDSPHPLVTQAARCRQAGDLAGALQALRRAAREASGDVAVLLALGLELDQQDQHAKAAEVLRDAAQRAPDSAEVLNALGNAEQGARRPARALECYRRAAELAPDIAALQINIGDMLRVLGHPAEAGQCFDRALALDPTNLTAHYHQAVLALAAGRPAIALEHLDACAETRPYLPEGLALRAEALARTGDDAQSARLLDHDRFVAIRQLDAPPGYPDIRRFNRALERHILTGRLVPDPFTASTRGGRHGDDLLAGASGPAAALDRMLKAAFADYINALPHDAGHPFLSARPATVRLIAQANILDSAGYLEDHVHPQAWVSGAYYVRLPAEIAGGGKRGQEGWLRFGALPASLNTETARPVRHVAPREGQLVLFPSYFYHGTVPFKGKRHRMSLGIDVLPR